MAQFLALLAFFGLFLVVTRSKKPNFIPDKALVWCRINVERGLRFEAFLDRFGSVFGLVGLLRVIFSCDEVQEN